MSTKRWLLAIAFSVLAAIAPPRADAQDRVRIQVGSSFGPQELATLKKMFEAENPDIELIWDREAPEQFTQRLLTGQGARPDAIWGLPIASMLALQRKGLLDPYAPKSLADIKPLFRDPADPPAWFGMNAWISAVCFNSAVAAKIGLARPISWLDLAEPRFKDKIAMPHPVTSATGYLLVAGWIKLFGEDRAWAFMDKLSNNIVSYEMSGVATCRHAATGIEPVGLSFDYAVAQVRQRGIEIEELVMKEGGGWEMNTSALLKDAPRPDAARRVMDFAASRTANQQYATLLGQVAMTGIEGQVAHYPPGVAESLAKADFAWMADNRERILTEWMRRYGSTAPIRN